MRFEFHDAYLEALACNPSAASPWPPAVLRLYRRRLQHIDAAQALSDLQASRALDTHVLQGEGQDVFSLRIDDSYCLIVRVVLQNSTWRATVMEVRASGRG